MANTERSTMRGLVLEAGRARVRDDLPRPTAAAGEVRVRVLRTGICATDVALLAGYMDFRGVPGHEFVGLALDGPLAGRRVVGEINAGCGVCARCRTGDPRHCTDRTVLGIAGRPGALAEELRLPEGNLVAVPEGLSDDAAIFAEPLAAALAVVEDTRPAPGLPVLVVGDGRLGLLCAAALREAGARVDLLGRHPERAERIGGGLRHLGRPLEPERDPRRYPLVVEASGRAECLPLALERVEPRGRLVLKTTTGSPVTLDPARIVVDELQVLGSRCGRFAPALELLAAGRVDPTPLIAERHPLERADLALERAARPGALKVVVDITSP